MVMQDDVERQDAGRPDPPPTQREEQLFRGKVAIAVGIVAPLLSVLAILGWLTLPDIFPALGKWSDDPLWPVSLVRFLLGPMMDVYIFCAVSLIYGIIQLATLPPNRPTTNCVHCGYDLTGNTSGVCPECGMQLKREE